MEEVIVSLLEWGLFVLIPIIISARRSERKLQDALREQQELFRRQLALMRFELESKIDQRAAPKDAKPDLGEASAGVKPAVPETAVETPVATPLPTLDIQLAQPSAEQETLIELTETPAEPEKTAVAPEETIEFETREPEPAQTLELKPLRLDAQAEAPESPDPTRQAQEFSLPPEKPTGNLDNLELLVGRKFFSWVGAFLFVVGAIFFLQIAIARGWLSAPLRFAGVLILSAVFLFFGRRVFRRGQRLFSDALNSAGVLSLAAAGYYARVADVFPWQVASIFMIGAVFFGFFLAVKYRSAVVSTVVSIGGLIVPFMIAKDPTPWTTTLYLLAFFASGVGVANLLKRSSLATIPWLGSFLALLIHARTLGLHDQGFKEGITFLIAFFTIDFIDLVQAMFRQKRRSTLADLARIGTTGFLCFGALWTFCRSTGARSAWFGNYAGYVALGAAALYGVVGVVAAKRPVHYEFDSDDDWIRARQTRGALASVDLRIMSVVAAFAFLAIGVGATFAKSFVAIGFLAISTGLFIFATWKLNKFQLPDFVLKTDSEERRRTLVASLENTALATIGMLTAWAFIYLVLGTILLITRNLFPNLYDLNAFFTVTDAKLVVEKFVLPFFNETAFATTLGAALALCALFALSERITARPKEDAGLAIDRRKFSSAETVLKGGAAVSGVIGAISALILSASEVFLFASARATAAELETPGVVGCAVVLFFWLAVSALLVAIGAFKKNRAFLYSGGGLWFAAAAKLLLLNAVRHKLLVGGALAPLIFPLEYLSDGRFDLLGLEAAAPVKPLVNAFSLPFLVAAILGMIYGVIICKSRSSDKPLRQFGLSTGLAGAVLLFVIASLDVAGFFYLCPDPERFIARSFFAAHAVWILWLGYAAIAWTIGRIFKSFPIRALAYCVLILELPCVFIGEFGSGDWRTNYQAVESILNVFAAPAACYFAALVVLAVFMRKARGSYPPGTIDANPHASAGVFFIGLVGVITLLSFETFRYFTGKTWFGPGDWSRLIGLSILWSLCAVLLKVAAALAKGPLSKLCSALGTILIAALIVKHFGFELFYSEFSYRWPVFNPLGAAALIIFFMLLGLASYYKRIANADLNSDVEEARERGKFKRNTAIVAGMAAVVQFWLSSSVDVYRCAEFFPRGESLDPVFLAQAALSVLWTLFASVLLGLGFYKHSRILRWSGIALFGVTILKVLTLDMAHLDSLYRVVAIFVLAAAIFMASGAYWRRRAK